MSEQAILAPSGRPIGDLATSTLRRYCCGLCDQRLDRMRKSPGNCAQLYGGVDCHWHDTLNPLAPSEQHSS